MMDSLYQALIRAKDDHDIKVTFLRHFKVMRSLY
jgi:hypothetical protein